MLKYWLILNRYPYGHEELAVCDDFDAVMILPLSYIASNEQAVI
jgi:hypothetical protein